MYDAHGCGLLDFPKALSFCRDFQADGVRGRQVPLGSGGNRRVHGYGPRPSDLLRLPQVQLGGPCGDHGCLEHDEGTGPRAYGAYGDGKGRLRHRGRAGDHAGDRADRRPYRHGAQPYQVSRGPEGGGGAPHAPHSDRHRRFYRNPGGLFRGSELPRHQ